MPELIEILTPSKRILTDTEWLSALQAYNQDPNGHQIKEQLTKIGPITFNTFTVSSVTTLAAILRHFSPEQRSEYIESIPTLPLPSFSSIEWVEFLGNCSVTQCGRFLEQLSATSCPELIGEHDFFSTLIANSILVSSEIFEKILIHIKHMQTNVPDIIPSNYTLRNLRYGGDNKFKRAQKISLTLKYMQQDLPNLTLSLEELVKCLSLKIGALQYDRNAWVLIKRAYLMGLATQLPYIFYAEPQVLLFYEKFSQENKRTGYAQSQDHQVVHAFSPEIAKNEFEAHEQTCFQELPKAYCFVSQHKEHHTQSDAETFIGLLVQEALETHATVKELDTRTPIQEALDALIQNIVISTPETCLTYVSRCFYQTPETQLAHDLSKLGPHWLPILNDHLPSLNWNPNLTTAETQHCFREYIDSVKPRQEQSYALLLKMLASFALSSVTTAIGIVLLCSLSAPVGATVIACGLAASGFFAYKAMNAPLLLSNQPTQALPT
jgi:hypothetical protein